MSEPEFRLLVCGGRDFHDRRVAQAWMSAAVDNRKNVVVIHGGARGADQLAGEIATAAGVSVRVFPADWETHGKRAGFIRNQQMLDEGKPHLVLALPGGRGTQMMIDIARKAGVPVIEVSP